LCNTIKKKDLSPSFFRMKTFRDLSLKKRLAAAFAAVVVFSALIITLVFTVVLVGSMKKAAREKIEETSRVALSRIEDVTRGLEIYANLISSNEAFGQILSYDSAGGIQDKIEEFKKMSQADLVAFVPYAERYLAIKDTVFVNAGQEALAPSLKLSAPVSALLNPFPGDGARGWISLGASIFVFAMQPVSHFGANMGVVLLGRFCGDRFAKDLSAAAGTEIIIFNASEILGTSVLSSKSRLEAIPDQAFFFKKDKFLDENLTLSGTSYLSYFLPIHDIEKKKIASLSLNVSNAPILEARNQTVTRVLFVAAVATLLSGLIGYFLARAISNPLIKITQGMFSIMEKGDLGIRIGGLFGAEIGVLTRSFNRLLDQLQDAHEKLASSERRMKQELTMASTVQEMLFPERSIKYGNLELASFIDTSSETGGDWFGYGATHDERTVTVLIGDVTGHGMPAALITAITNGFFAGVQESTENHQSLVSQVDAFKRDHPEVTDLLKGLETLRQQSSFSTAQMLSLLNQIILRSTKRSLLMTFFVSVIDLKKGEMRYANAGHNRPWHCRSLADGRRHISVLRSDPSPRLGEDANVEFVENTIAIRPGDLFLWYTDGILECENPAGEMYGKRRLMTLLQQTKGSAEEIKKTVIDDAYAFFGDRPRKDDITLVVGRVLDPFVPPLRAS